MGTGHIFSGVFVRNVTLCLPISHGGEKLLLGMKKRGFGEGKWNGFGGKVAQGERVTEAAKRELLEESGLEANTLEKVAELEFFFPHKPDWNQKGHVFLVREWQGEARESDEMLPKWFCFDEIPFEKMWADDPYWLSRVLKGEKLWAKFVFTTDEKVAGYEINPL